MKSPDACRNIEDVRQTIDKLDREIINLLGKRFKYVKKIVKFKTQDQDSIIAKERQDAVIQSRRKLAEENGLNPDIIESVYRILINYFIEEEFALIKNENKD